MPLATGSTRSCHTTSTTVDCAVTPATTEKTITILTQIMRKLKAEQEWVIREFYEDPQTTGNAKALYRAIKMRGIRGIIQQTILDWLNNLEFKQRNKKYQMSGYYIPVKPRQEYQLDVMYFIEANSDLKQYKRFDGVAPKTFARNKGLKYGLVCVDIFTKYADVEPMRRKTTKETTGAVLRKRRGD